ncbi:heavy-metal-associated domain-containing protein [uncultured Desulfovibrio sp.]|uniref:heavy-metal-associated domain-containing protein n=1 Tax=uncultured Desulfovibrio sp. TaxID=167968 RepID=UPI0025E076E4|nr:heavy metal-associated domain-containing protein [uncultured Desulfovibrio sp.]
MPTIKVNGMHCANCKDSVEKAVSAIPGVKSAKVDLDKKELYYEEDKNMPIALDIIMGAIHDLGYEPENPRP